MIQVVPSVYWRESHQAFSHLGGVLPVQCFTKRAVSHFAAKMKTKEAIIMNCALTSSLFFSTTLVRKLCFRGNIIVCVKTWIFCWRYVRNQWNEPPFVSLWGRRIEIDFGAFDFFSPHSNSSWPTARHPRLALTITAHRAAVNTLLLWRKRKSSTRCLPQVPMWKRRLYSWFGMLNRRVIRPRPTWRVQCMPWEGVYCYVVL